MVDLAPDPYFMPLNALTSTYMPFYPENATWDETADYLLSNPADHLIINELMRQHQRTGNFRQPIILEVPYEPESDALQDPLRVADGTHRVVASILLGVEHVLVQEDHSPVHDFDEPWSYASTTLIITKLEEKDEDILFDMLRSFPLDEDTWVTSSVMSGTTDDLTLCWDNEPTPEFQARYPEINAYIMNTLNTHGITLESVNTITQTEDV